MSEKKVESVYFVDGVVIEHDYIYFASKLKSLDPEEYDFTRLFFLDQNNWNHHDLEWDVVSVCIKSKANDEPRSYCALSAQGDIEFQFPGGTKIEKIKDAGTYSGLGAVKQIAEIGNNLYVCGDQGQVYCRNNSGWVHIDDGILDRDISATALDLNGIDGTDENNIYVVGYNGRILYRNGNKWLEIESPTNQHLERVYCVSPEEVYICGNNGVFLKGNWQGFQDYSMSNMSDNFWDLEYFNERVYLAALNGLYVFDGSQIIKVETDLDPDIGGYRLSANDGVIWSFGVDDLAYFDGHKWIRVIHPDNV